MEPGCGRCSYGEPEEGASACRCNNGRLGSGPFGGGGALREETAAAGSSASPVPRRTETGLGNGASAAGGWDLWEKLRLALALALAVVVVTLPAGLSRVSTPCEVGGKAALPVAGGSAAAGGGRSSFRGGSGDWEE